jgi:hypothetical protein
MNRTHILLAFVAGALTASTALAAAALNGQRRADIDHAAAAAILDTWQLRSVPRSPDGTSWRTTDYLKGDTPR